MKESKACMAGRPALGKSLDVGIDGHDFTPWAWDEIKAYMANRPHNENFVGHELR